VAIITVIVVVTYRRWGGKRAGSCEHDESQ